MTDPSHQEATDDGLGGLVRRVLSTGPSPEERLEELLAERRRELDETAARFDESIADLERREELLRDSRASVERMLRIGRTDLEARENELTDFLRDVGEREARLASAEAELARRRQELGAVELKRASVERREQEVEEQRAALEAEEAALAARATLLDAHEAALVAREAALVARETAPAARETLPVVGGAEPVARETTPAAPETAPGRQEAAAAHSEMRIAEPAAPAAPAAPSTPSAPGEPQAQTVLTTDAELAFVPGAEYRLLELTVPASRPGDPVEVDGEELVVVRFGPSPLPGDRRRCAYLVRGTLPGASRGSS
jgi:hypothetical protein